MPGTIPQPNNDSLSFIKEFEDNWQIIYNEYLTIKELMVDWPEKHLYNKGWEVFGLFNWIDINALSPEEQEQYFINKPNADELIDNTQYCPFTAQLIKNSFPGGYGVAGFSRLSPKTVLEPHRGSNGLSPFKRAHLGLEIPDGDCALKVEETVIHWQPGKMIIFDDSLLHSAWNQTDKERVVLIVDFYD
jgi:beta-hydroxylase